MSDGEDTLRQRLLIALAAVGVLIALVVGVGAGGDGDGGDYKVRAIFDNAAFAIPGEDVMVAGAKVGTVDALDGHAGQARGGHPEDRRAGVPGLPHATPSARSGSSR